MNLRRTVFTLCVGGVVLLAASACQALIDTKQIDEIVKKTTLSTEDLQAIDEFLADAMQDLVGAVDFADASKTRAVILKYQTGKQDEYGKRYSEAVYKQIERGLASAKETADPAKRSRVAANMLILADALKDPRSMDLAVKAISEKNPPIRYWAVRISTDPNLWAKLNQNQASAAQLTTKLLTEFNQAAPSSAPEVLALMSGFAGPINAPAADELLTRIADARIKQYGDWTVSYELADVTILRQLSEKIASGSAAKSQLAKRFAQLYSFAIQRYTKGQRLIAQWDQSRDNLATVLIETEDKCIGKLLGAPQVTIRKAVEANDAKALQTEHDRLFGAAGQPGVLPAKFSFTYGADGQNLPAPLPLLDPTTRPTASPSTPAAPK
jgi:hypothetical protein